MMKARTGFLMAGALSLSLLASAEDSPRQVAPPKRIPDVVPGVALDGTQPTGEPVNTANMPRLVRRAVVADAARRFQVAESSVVLVNAEQVTWGDGSLGCPQPGRSYTQMLVEGYRVTATTAAGRMLYHTDMRGNVTTCVLPVRQPPRADDASRGTGAEPRTQPPEKDAPDR
jgi:hypothetical protein